MSEAKMKHCETHDTYFAVDGDCFNCMVEQRKLAELGPEWVDLQTIGNGWEFTRVLDGKRYGAVTKDGAFVGEYEARYPLFDVSTYGPGPCMVRRVP